MRAAALAIAMLVPLTAAAGPFNDVIVQPAKHAPTGTKHFVSASHLIYLNPCMPNGCNVQPGFDDSRTDHSSIPQQASHLAAYPWGSTSWTNLVQCVKDMYAPFDIQITDVDPGTAAHFELMVGGRSTDIGIQGAGGVAPFIPCAGEMQDNVISFVFAAETQSPDFLCWAAAQETSHVFGLDHELNAKDPMTYLSPPVKKPGFQNEASNCGENTPRQCWCGGTTQNSAQFLLDTFGPAHLDPPSMTIAAPTEGTWVKPGFKVRAEATSQLSIKSSALAIDGTTSQSITQTPLVFDTPASLAGGDHKITVSATDSGSRSFSADVNVHVVASCASGGACANDFKCLGGYCLPSASVPGGLGATCADGAGCITGTCGTDGNEHLCTAPCDPGMTCPDGFQCLQAATGSGVCWPGAASNGGCTTTSNGTSPLLLFAGLGVLLAIVRRRR